MTGSRDRFADKDSGQLADDLELDMDAPLGAAFAAALRERGTDLAGVKLIDDFDFDDGQLPSAETPASTYAFEDSADDADLEFDAHDQDDFATNDFTPKAQPAKAPIVATGASAPPAQPPVQAFAPPRASAPQPYARADFGDDDFGRDDPAPPPQLASAPAVAFDAEPDEDAAGGGLGFDYAFAPTADGGDRPIPRIAVHAFCTRTPMLGLMRTIQKDRRMRNVTMDVFEGGAAVAIDHYVNETTPNLLILESSAEPRQLLGELDQLAQHCDESIRVVVVGYTNDIRLYRELMRRGVSEYLVAPIDPVHMIRAISNLFTDPDAPFTGKTLAVTGVKGGVGASSIAHNLAWALSERVKVNATLVDLDLNFGTTGLDFNQDAGATIADALMSPDRFDDAVMGRLITKATDRLSLFTAPATLDRTYNLDPDTYVRVLEQVRTSVPFVVLDLPHIWSDWFKGTIIGADEIVIVAGPDLASLRNGKNLIDFLKAARPNDQPPKLVLNMVGLPKRPEIPAKDFGQAIGLEPTLVLPFDAQLFGTAANNGQMVFDIAPESKVAQGLDQLATQLSGREIQTAKPSMLKKLLRR